VKTIPYPKKELFEGECQPSELR